MIFVFGSNLAGIHGAGAARHAALHYGAVRGEGNGRTGRAYALPTKDRKIQTISLTAIRMFVRDFINHAAENADQTFQITQIGCGLAGYTADQIAPMFKDAPTNCHFDTAWKTVLGDKFKYWGHQP